MKKLTTSAVLVIMALWISSACHGQSLLERAASKAKQKLEQRAEKKAEEKIDGTIENQAKENEAAGQSRSETDGENSAQRDQRRMQGILKGIGLSGEPVPIEDSYSFSSRIQMHMESRDKNNKITSTEKANFLCNSE